MKAPTRKPFMRSTLLTALIIATALFMENMDGTVISTSLPAIAHDLHQDPIVLKLALTSYMLTLAVFIPASGWVADRFGARTVFCSAIVVFTLGSILCGASSSLPTLIAARVFQGLGGAMMVPVGRLVLLRSVQKSELVSAMAYLTVPALIGPVAGPPLGGFITTYFQWRWIFWINVPIGILGILLSLRFIHNLREEAVPRFDFKGFLLSGVGLVSLIAGISVIGRGIAPAWLVVAMVGVGALALAAYARHAADNEDAILDLKLLRIPTFFAGVVGGLIFRIGIGAMPFLLPLLLQIGFGLTPFESGSLTFATAAGALLMKFTASTALALVRLPAHADRQRLDLRGVSGRLRPVHADHAALAIVADAADRRLFPFARIHRPQRHQLRRHRPAADEPRHKLRQRVAANVGRDRGGGGGDLRADNPARLRRSRAAGARSFALLRDGRDHLEPVGLRFRQAQAGRGRGGVGQAHGVA